MSEHLRAPLFPCFRYPNLGAFNVDRFVCTCLICLALDHQLPPPVALPLRWKPPYRGSHRRFDLLYRVISFVVRASSENRISESLPKCRLSGPLTIKRWYLPDHQAAAVASRNFLPLIKVKHPSLTYGFMRTPSLDINPVGDETAPMSPVLQLS